MGESRKPSSVLPPSLRSGEPTVGDIKRALYDLSRSTDGAASRDTATILREINDLVRRFALLSGVDPDDALQRRRDSRQAQRDGMLMVTAAAPGPSST